MYGPRNDRRCGAPSVRYRRLSPGLVLVVVIVSTFASPMSTHARPLGGLTSATLTAFRSAATNAGPAVVVADSFSSGSGLGGRSPQDVGIGPWRVISGNWQIVGGALRGPSSPNAPSIAVIGIPPGSVPALVLGVDVEPAGGRAGIIVCSAPGASVDRVPIVTVDAGGTLIVGVLVGGVIEVRGSAVVPTAVPHRISVSVVSAANGLTIVGTAGPGSVATTLIGQEAAACGASSDVGLVTTGAGTSRFDDFYAAVRP
jgi:hypothetical protein